MATTTIAVEVPQDEWTEIVDGASIASCQLQVTSVQPVAIAVATAEPAADATGFALIGSTQPLVPLTLAVNELIWARGFGGGGTVRLIQVDR